MQLIQAPQKGESTQIHGLRVSEITRGNHDACNTTPILSAQVNIHALQTPFQAPESKASSIFFLGPIGTPRALRSSSFICMRAVMSTSSAWNCIEYFSRPREHSNPSTVTSDFFWDLLLEEAGAETFFHVCYSCFSRRSTFFNRFSTLWCCLCWCWSCFWWTCSYWLLVHSTR